MRDPKTGLLRHGWDESKPMPWADKTTGLSPEVWARAMGWYVMALVDVLDWFPADHPKRAALVAALNRNMAAVIKAQDAKSGLWWQVMSRPPHNGPAMEKQPDGSIRAGIMHESERQLLRGLRQLHVYLRHRQRRSYGLPAARRRVLRQRAHGKASRSSSSLLMPTARLPFTAPSKSAVSAEHPIALATSTTTSTSPSSIRTPRASAPLCWPAPRWNKLLTRPLVLPKPVCFQVPKTTAPDRSQRLARPLHWSTPGSTPKPARTPSARPSSFHYKWSDDSNNGYSFFGRAFRRYGVKLATEPAAPTAASLAQAQIYVIASPDIPVQEPQSALHGQGQR